MTTRTRRQVAAALLAGGFAVAVPMAASAATDPAPTPPGMMAGAWDADDMLEFMQSPQHEAFMNAPGHDKFMQSQGHDEFMSSPAHERVMGEMACHESDG